MNFLYTYTPLKFFNQSFWRDEAFSYVLAHKNILEILFYTARDFNPPLYYILLHIWMNIFGSSEISLRTLSFLFFWGTVYLAFDFMHDVLHISYKKASFYIFLIIINPILLFYAFEARMYTMLSFFAALSYYSLHTNRKKLYIASLILGLYTHYFMIFVVLAQMVYVFIIRKKNTALKKLLLPYIYTAAAFIPWAIYAVRQEKGDSFWIKSNKIQEFFIIPGVMYTGFETFLDYYAQHTFQILFSLISITIVLLTIIAIGYNKIKKQKNVERNHIFLSLAMWAFSAPILTFVISIFKPVFLPRYLIFSTIGLLLLTIYSLERMKKNAKIALALLLVVLTVHHISFQLTYRSKENISKVMHEIKRLAKKNDVMYVNDLDFFTAQYYFYEDRVYIYNKSYDDISQFVGKTLINKDRIKFTLPSYPQKAFILKENREYDISAAF